MKLRLISSLIVTALVLYPSLAAAQGVIQALNGGRRAAEDEDKAPTVKLVLHPAVEPRPALQYQLLPSVLDQRPGNAAVLYGKVTAEQQAFFGDKDLWEKIPEWNDTPLEDFPKDEAEGALQGSHFKILDRAARCQYIDWQLPLREQPFYQILLPELSQTRNFGRMLGAKARLKIAQGEFDEAVHTFQTGYAMAKHVGQGQTLIHGLVGIAISKTISKQVETFIQQPDAPNLYWALTNLHDPLIDMRPGIEAEWAMIYLSYPELRDLDQQDYTPEEWRKRLNDLTETVFEFTGDGAPVGHEVLTTALALKGYPVARQGLIDRGYAAINVDAMPVPKVVLLYTMQTYEELRDDMFKWFAVPYPQAKDDLDRAESQLKPNLRREVIPFASILLPAIKAAHFAGARGQRTVAVLRVVEAIRLHGAAYDGKLPDKLSDVTTVPIPLDPTTGEPFIYQRNGDTALLESPGGSHRGLRYEITFAK
jgi:hypothetical protein